jgi:hypothetical protein
MKQTLKVAARFVHNDAVTMSAIFAKTEAKEYAKHVVIDSIGRLDKRGIFKEPNFAFCDNIIAEVRAFAKLAEMSKDPDLRIKLQKMAETLKDPDHLRVLQGIIEKLEDPVSLAASQKLAEKLKDAEFCGLLHDAACKESVDKGKLSIRLKTRKTGVERDARKDLKSDLRELAEAGDWEKWQKATKLAALLDAVKNFPEAGNVPRAKSLRSLFISHSDTLGDLAVYLPANEKKYFQEKVKPLRENLRNWEAMDARRPALKDAVENMKSEYRWKVAQAFIDAYGKDLENISDFIGGALTELLHPDKVAQYKRELARSVAGNVVDKLRGRLAKMDVALNSKDGYEAVLKVSRQALKEEGYSELDREAMDEALQEECWKAVEDPNGELASEPEHGRLGNVSPRKIQAALADLRGLLEDYLSGSHLIHLIGTHFEVFSGPIWIHEDARVSLNEYLGLGCALHALDRLANKTEYTKEDVQLLLSTLKEQENSSAVEGDLAGILFLKPSDLPRKEASDFNLERPDETRSAMIAAVYDHYFAGQDKSTNLIGVDFKKFEGEFQNAEDAQAKLNALKTGFTLLLKQTPFQKDRLVPILEDLALLCPAYVTENPW